MAARESRSASKRGMLPPTYLLLAIVAMTAFHFRLPLRQILPFPWRLLGLLPFLIGLTLNLAADRQFKQQETTVKPFERSTSHITTGVYQISRNPMYLGFVLILLGIGILLGSLSPLLVVPPFGVLLEVVFIRAEERKMAAEFGQAWHIYKEQVRRWI